MDSLGTALSRLTKEYRRPSVGIGAAAALVYALQAFSPLRLNNDNTRLLEMANNFLLGRGFEGSYMPSGYPAFVVILDHIDMATPFGLVFANVLLFAVGLYLVYEIVRRVEPDVPGLPVAIVAVSLFSYLSVKYSAKPQSEILFFALSALVLRLSVSLDGPGYRRFAMVAAMVPLIALAIWVRSIGVMLLAAAAVAILVAWTGRLDTLSSVAYGGGRSRFIAAAALVCAVVAAFAVAKLGAPVYVGQFEARDHFFEPSALAGHAAAKATIVFQVLFNVPGRLIDSVPPFLAVCGGGLGLVLVALGFYVSRRRFNAVDAYALASVCLLLVWPYYQPRYWFPVLPFLFLILIRGARVLPWVPLVKGVLLVWVGGFFSLGVTSFVFTTWLTMSGNAFPERYTSGELRTVYRAAFDGTCPQSLTPLSQLTYDTLLRLETNAVPCIR